MAGRVDRISLSSVLRGTLSFIARLFLADNFDVSKGLTEETPPPRTCPGRVVKQRERAFRGRREITRVFRVVLPTGCVLHLKHGQVSRKREKSVRAPTTDRYLTSLRRPNIGRPISRLR